MSSSEPLEKVRRDPHLVLSRVGRLRRIVPGIVALVFGLMILDYYWPNPLESYCLMQLKRPAMARLTNAFEGADEDFRGREGFFSVVSFSFQTETGASVHTRTRKMGEALPDEWLYDETGRIPVKIEYCPLNPNWAQLSGLRDRSFMAWFIEDLLLWVIPFGYVVAPGIWLLSNGRKEVCEAKKAPLESQRQELSPYEKQEEKVWVFGWCFGIVFAVFVFFPLTFVPGVLRLSAIVALLLPFLYARWKLSKMS